MESLIGLVVTLGALAIAIGVGGAALSVATDRRMVRDGAMEEGEAQYLRAEIVRQVGDASTEPRMQIDLRPFWHDLSLTPAQRYVLLKPLLERKVLHAVVPVDRSEAFLTFVARTVLSRPTNWVILNSRDWGRLASGTSAGIVIGDVSGVVQIGDQNRATLTQDITPDFVERLIRALRTDAAAAVLHAPAAERADSLADSLESDLEKHRWSTIVETVKTISGIAASGATIWAATASHLGIS